MKIARHELAKTARAQFSTPLSALLLALLPLAMSCGSDCRTELRGKWQCGGFRIAVYEDGIASFAGVRASWKTLGGEMLRLEFQADGESQIAELSLEASGAKGVAAPFLDLAGLWVQCDEVVIDDEE